MDIDNLERMVDDAVAVFSVDNKQKFKKDALAEINPQHVGAASVSMNSLQSCSPRETWRCLFYSLQMKVKAQSEQFLESPDPMGAEKLG